MGDEKDINTQNIVTSSAPSSNEDISSKKVRLMGIKLGEDEFMVNVLRIQEIVRTVDITVVPGSDKRILGVINLRDSVVPVIDLRMMFRIGNTELTSATKVMILRADNEGVGILIDNISHMITLDVSAISEATANVGFIGQEYLIGISLYNNKSVAILDVDKIIGRKQDSANTFEQRVNLALLLDTPNKDVVAETQQSQSQSQSEPALPSKEELDKYVESEIQKRLSEELNKIKSKINAIPTQEQIDQLIDSEVHKRVSQERNKMESELEKKESEIVELARELEKLELEKELENLKNEKLELEKVALANKERLTLSDEELSILGSRGTISSTGGVHLRGGTHFSGIRIDHADIKKPDVSQRAKQAQSLAQNSFQSSALGSLGEVASSDETKAVDSALVASAQVTEGYSYTDEVPYSEPMQLDAAVEKLTDEELGYVESISDLGDISEGVANGSQLSADVKVSSRQSLNIKTETIKMPPFGSVLESKTQVKINHAEGGNSPTEATVSGRMSAEHEKGTAASVPAQGSFFQVAKPYTPDVVEVTVKDESAKINELPQAVASKGNINEGNLKKSLHLLFDIHRYIDGLAKVDGGDFIDTDKKVSEVNKFIQEFEDLSGRVSRGVMVLEDNINKSDYESFALNKENFENMIVEIDMLRIKTLNLLKSYGVSQLGLSKLMDMIGDVDLKIINANKLVN